jgi:hypothetical protein
MILETISNETLKKFPESKNKVIVSIFFLRFFCPKLCVRALKYSEKIKRAALVISKVMQLLVNRALVDDQLYLDGDYLQFNDFFQKNLEKIENFTNILTNQSIFKESKKKSEIVLKIENETILFKTKRVSKEVNNKINTTSSASKSTFKKNTSPILNENLPEGKIKLKKKKNSEDNSKINTLSFLQKLRAKNKKSTEFFEKNRITNFPLFIFENIKDLREKFVFNFSSGNINEEFIEIDNILSKLERLSSSQSYINNYFKNLKKDSK